ncbi:MAG TPA: DUF937 domain-containing protein [Xanthomonadaceae bacterium]|jgi:hypothetical protein
MNALLEQVMGAIDPSVVQQLAARMGVPADEAEDAIGHAMPAMLDAFSRHAGSPGGADAIHVAAQQLLGSGAGDANVQGLLGRIFSSPQGSALQGLSAAAELPDEHVQHLLSVLGPVILSAIGQHAAQTGTNAQGLEQVLGAAAQHAQSQGGGISGLLGSLFGQY